MTKRKVDIIYASEANDATDILNTVVNDYDWKNIGIVAQSIPLINTFTVFDNIALYSCYSKRMALTKLENTVSEFLSSHNIRDIIYCHSKVLNKFELFLTHLIRATIHSPKILLIFMPQEFLGIAVYNKFTKMLSEDKIDIEHIIIVENISFAGYYSNIDLNQIGLDEWQIRVIKTLS